jgi:hypothetical protein
MDAKSMYEYNRSVFQISLENLSKEHAVQKYGKLLATWLNDKKYESDHNQMDWSVWKSISKLKAICINEKYPYRDIIDEMLSCTNFNSDKMAVNNLLKMHREYIFIDSTLVSDIIRYLYGGEGTAFNPLWIMKLTDLMNDQRFDSFDDLNHLNGYLLSSIDNEEFM